MQGDFQISIGVPLTRIYIPPPNVLIKPKFGVVITTDEKRQLCIVYFEMNGHIIWLRYK